MPAAGGYSGPRTLCGAVAQPAKNARQITAAIRRVRTVNCVCLHFMACGCWLQRPDSNEELSPMHLFYHETLVLPGDAIRMTHGGGFGGQLATVRDGLPLGFEGRNPLPNRSLSRYHSITGLGTSTALLDNYGLGHGGLGNGNWRMCGHGCTAPCHCDMATPRPRDAFVFRRCIGGGNRNRSRRDLDDAGRLCRRIWGAQQWTHLPIFILTVALIAFVQFYFHTAAIKPLPLRYVSLLFYQSPRDAVPIGPKPSNSSATIWCGPWP